MGWQPVQVDGTQYQFYRQSFHLECGPSCVVMVAKILGKGLSINQARYVISKDDPAHKKTFKSNWNQDFSYTNSLASALSNQGIKDSRTRKSLSPARYKALVTQESTPKTPSILRAILPYGHFIVCLGISQTNPGAINILDPEYDHGLVTVPVWGMYPAYHAPDGRTGTLDRHWSVSTS
jgi:ABC-type bacteriocin/lantibiotic exporter with double-glycine peptidase domain